MHGFKQKSLKINLVAKILLYVHREVILVEIICFVYFTLPIAKIEILILLFNN